MNYPGPGPVSPRSDNPGYRPAGARRNTWLWISLAIAIVIIAVLSVVVIKQSSEKSPTPPSTAAAPPQSSTSQSAPQPPSTQAPPLVGSGAPSMTCEGFTASIDESSNPGWHAAINRLGLGYAAPPDWNVAACGVRMGWAKPCPAGQCVISELGAVSTVANPACPKQNLAMAGVTQSKNPDIRAALDEESKTVPVIYTQSGKEPTVQFSPVQEFTIGTHPAVQTVATVNDIATDECFGSSAVHSIVVTTVPNVEGSVVFVMSLRQGVNATPKPNVINQVVKTLRSPP